MVFLDLAPCDHLKVSVLLRLQNLPAHIRLYELGRLLKVKLLGDPMFGRRRRLDSGLKATGHFLSEVLFECEILMRVLSMHSRGQITATHRGARAVLM